MFSETPVNSSAQAIVWQHSRWWQSYHWKREILSQYLKHKWWIFLLQHFVWHGEECAFKPRSVSHNWLFWRRAMDRGLAVSPRISSFWKEMNSQPYAESPWKDAADASQTQSFLFREPRVCDLLSRLMSGKRTLPSIYVPLHLMNTQITTEAIIL